MTPELTLTIQSYTLLILLLLLIYGHWKCCQELKDKLTATLAWLHTHHDHHKKLGQAVCNLERLAAGEDQSFDQSSRVCPGGGGDGYGQGDPPPI